MRDQTDYDEIQSRVVEIFEQRQRLETLGAWTAEHWPQLCTFACPNRWLFRIAADALVIFWLVLGVIALFCACDWARPFRRYWLAWALLALGTFGVLFTLLTCDPFWRDRQNTVLIVALLLGIASVAAILVKRARQGQRP